MAGCMYKLMNNSQLQNRKRAELNTDDLGQT